MILDGSFTTVKHWPDPLVHFAVTVCRRTLSWISWPQTIACHQLSSINLRAHQYAVHQRSSTFLGGGRRSRNYHVCRIYLYRLRVLLTLREYLANADVLLAIYARISQDGTLFALSFIFRRWLSTLVTRVIMRSVEQSSWAEQNTPIQGVPGGRWCQTGRFAAGVAYRAVQEQIN